MTEATPTLALAAAAAEAATGRRPVEVRRFSIGVAHHVFEALFGDGASIVVRMGGLTQRGEMANGVRLNRLLRPLGVPLPDLRAEGLDQPLPWVAMERLPGTDLGEVIGTLSATQRSAVAREIAKAQAATAQVPTAGRYGYAAVPESAPYAVWSDVLRANLDRSRARIEAARLFDQRPVDAVAKIVDRSQADLDRISAVSFLHDTTTRNVIVALSGTLSGIVDVDDLCFGDPRYAPALTFAALIASDRPTDYVAAWMQSAGHRDDRVFRLYVALFLVDLMAEHGQRFNGNERPSALETRKTLQKAFSRAILHYVHAPKGQ